MPIIRDQFGILQPYKIETIFQSISVDSFECIAVSGQPIVSFANSPALKATHYRNWGYISWILAFKCPKSSAFCYFIMISFAELNIYDVCTSVRCHNFCYCLLLRTIWISLAPLRSVWISIRWSLCHDIVIKWKQFPRYWPFVRGIHRSPVNSPHKGQRRGALMFSLIFVWINSWVNNREAGDLRRHRAHYDAIVMVPKTSSSILVICTADQ